MKKGKIKKGVRKVRESVKEEFMLNVPNIITLFRLVLTFLFVYMLFSDYPKIAIVVVFAVAAISDWFDGYFARKLKQTSPIGARLDQVIDRLFTIIIVIALAFFLYNQSGKYALLPLFLIMSREIIGFPGFIIRIILNKPPYAVKYIGKLTTFIQSFTLGFIILGVNWAVYPAILTCFIGVVSGFDYLKDSLS